MKTYLLQSKDKLNTDIYEKNEIIRQNNEMLAISEHEKMKVD